jgi:hypothetical protein
MEQPETAALTQQKNQMKYYSLRYSLRVWLTSVLLAPLIYIIVQWVLSSNRFDPDSVLGFYPIIVFFELIFSFVTWLIFWGITELTAIFLMKKSLRKWLMFIAGISLTAGTFLLFSLPVNSFSFNDISFDLMLSNCFCIGIGSWYFRLGPGGSSPNLSEMKKSF